MRTPVEAELRPVGLLCCLEQLAAHNRFVIGSVAGWVGPQACDICFWEESRGKVVYENWWESYPQKLFTGMAKVAYVGNKPPSSNCKRVELETNLAFLSFCKIFAGLRQAAPWAILPSGMQTSAFSLSSCGFLTDKGDTSGCSVTGMSSISGAVLGTNTHKINKYSSK